MHALEQLRDRENIRDVCVACIMWNLTFKQIKFVYEDLSFILIEYWLRAEFYK